MVVALSRWVNYIDVEWQAAKDITTDLRGPCGFFLHNNGLHDTTELAKFEITEYSSQVVAGTMHRVTVRGSDLIMMPGHFILHSAFVQVDIGKADVLKLRVLEFLPCNRAIGGPRFDIKHLELGSFSKEF